MSHASATPETAAPKVRRLKAPTRGFRRFKRSTPAGDAELVKPLPPAHRILGSSIGMLIRNWKPFVGIIVIYGIGMVLLVRGFSDSSSLAEIKQMLNGAGAEQLTASTALFVYLLGTSGNTTSDVAGAYQVILTIITSLALVWTLRHVYAGKRVRIRDGFYFGMYPLVPVLLVLGVVIVQLVPFAVGSFLFAAVQSSSIAVGSLELTGWALLYFALTLVSLYFLTASLIALYIVCLPDMQPMAALRSARDLVRGRRWAIMRKLAFLPFVLLIAAALLMIPLIMFAAAVAAWVFFALSMLGLLIAHSYMYRLYRELL